MTSIGPKYPQRPALHHESITTTMHRYSHLLPEQQISAAAAVDLALEGL